MPAMSRRSGELLSFPIMHGLNVILVNIQCVRNVEMYEGNPGLASQVIVSNIVLVINGKC